MIALPCSCCGEKHSVSVDENGSATFRCPACGEYNHYDLPSEDETVLCLSCAAAPDCPHRILKVAYEIMKLEWLDRELLELRCLE